MKKATVWLFAAACLVAAVNGLAAVGDSSGSAELKRLLQQGQSLEGNFKQRLTDRDGNLLQATEGRFVVQRPGSFYWETFPPYEQIVVGNSETLWVYDPDLEQVTVHNQTQQQQASPAQILSGDLEDLDKQYQVERATNDNRQEFTLTNKDADSMFSRLKLSYRDDVLTGLEFEDNLGQVTDLSFSETSVNPEIDPGLFQFKVPAGVDVIVDD